ncbi:hypothetical protein [Gimesia fumaroli]|uniref:Uncharacterized protein n=1 Tax=Gimesia fumaroli TaxID=2527976 RepID=A0A518IAJ9_9PLAN|nr:hypothetical protein [Gimesia fumaroli]QDV50148.1 hypothetical protein Enr17x_21860 [Gimesia fumaroli]
MKTSNHRQNQSTDRPVQGKPPRLRWLFPFFLIGGNLVFASLLLLMRGTGLFQIQQSFLPLLTIGGLLSCVSTGTLLLIRLLRLMNLSSRQKHGLTLALVLPVLAGMLSVMPQDGLNLTGILFFSLAYFLAFAGVLEVLDREGTSESESEFLAFSKPNARNLISQTPDLADSVPIQPESEFEQPTSSEESNEALFEALLGQSDAVQEMTEADERREKRSQWMNRSKDPDGCEVIEGGTLVQFAKNQKASVVHIGLFPPVEGTLQVVCAFEFGMAVRARVLETRGYGISVEVKRTYDLAHAFETEMNYRITNQALNEDVA